jgi:hypothetical protein
LRGLAICPICEAPLDCQTIDGKRRYRRAGDTDLADQAMRELGRIEAEADELRERIAAAEARLGEWTAEPDLDAALDFHNRLVDHARGRIADAATAVELNAALSSVLAGAWLALDDHDQLHATFRLRPGSEPLERRRPA